MKAFLDEAIALRGTDVHLTEGGITYVRREGELVPLDVVSTVADFTILAELLGTTINALESSTCTSQDGSFTYDTLRVRAHIFKANSKLCATLRLLYTPQLQLSAGTEDDILRYIGTLQDGLVLVVGPTSSGKSYTLACCINYMNETSHKHIITIEDPVEFLFESKSSLVHQRELHRDVRTMADGVRDALREDPDIIMVGELRDLETLKAALHAAETGHLVLATMHTQRAVMAVNRMISMFPPAQQEEVRSQLSQILRVVICQRLVFVDGRIVVPRDILLNTPAVSNLIRQRKEPQIRALQETVRPMQTLEMAVEQLLEAYGALPELQALWEQINETISI